MPAALVMATTRSILRAGGSGRRLAGVVLERANNLLCPDIPAKMFVTCLYAMLDPHTGRCATRTPGMTCPIGGTTAASTSCARRGMPLGLMPGMRYEEKAIMLAAGESVLLL